MAQKPSIPKGTRDFSPVEVAKRDYIFTTIKSVFQTFGFQSIETPSFENSETLMGKYGEEGDRLIFKILNSGNFSSKIYGFIAIKTKFFLEKLVENKNTDWTVEGIKSEAEKTILLISEKGIDSRKIFNDDYYEKLSTIINERYLSELKQDSGEVLNSVIDEIVALHFINWSTDNSRLIESLCSEKALRYDLTVPFARYVVQHQNEIEFPFKRYQIQPVWRADRPQKGRFREFYQCDADVVGSDSLWQEVDFVQLYDTVFTKLGLNGVTVKMNNRKILSGIAEIIDASDKLIDFTVALDKLDKIGKEGVTKEMLEKGISEEAIEKVAPLFDFTGTNQEKLNQLANMLASSVEGTKGVEELRFIIDTIETIGLQSANLTLDVTLARGLNYYTGAIFEVAAPEGVKMGSIGGGGRYDDLTGIFGLKDMSGVGISFGLDRIYLVLEELGLFEEVAQPRPDILFINFGNEEALYATKAIAKLRAEGIKSELYPSDAKMKKQMMYANKRNIPFVVLVGSKEIEEGTYTLKNMSTGEQLVYKLNELLQVVINS